MISRSLSRYDEQFIRNALSAQERPAALVKLRRQRWFNACAGLTVVLFLGLIGIMELVQGRLSQPPLVLVFVLALLMINQVEFSSQVRLLEILQRLQLTGTTASTQDAEPIDSPAAAKPG